MTFNLRRLSMAASLASHLSEKEWSKLSFFFENDIFVHRDGFECATPIRYFVAQVFVVSNLCVLLSKKRDVKRNAVQNGRSDREGGDRTSTQQQQRAKEKNHTNYNRS
eukprot:GDKJ01054802.1.p1 GENE.GDKJ01054802.1~~GDKJ01054802.1.p1  ORF type:complete len:108 (+),score=19.18 GDKJ01054802.1:378-701(+)